MTFFEGIYTVSWYGLEHAYSAYDIFVQHIELICPAQEWDLILMLSDIMTRV